MPPRVPQYRFPLTQEELFKLNEDIRTLFRHTEELPPKFDVVRTTDATVTTLSQFELDDNAAYLIEATVVARRTGGTAGTAGDSAAYVLNGLFYRVSAGAATQVGSTTVDVSIESVAAYDCVFDVTGNDVRVRVTGVANTNITWSATVKMKKVTR